VSRGGEPAGRPDYARPGSDVVVVRVSAATGAVSMGDAAEEAWLTGNEAAALAGLPPSTFRNYVAIGRAPKADDPDADTPQNRRRPLWRRTSVLAWLNSPKERAIKKRRRRPAGE